MPEISDPLTDRHRINVKNRFRSRQPDLAYLDRPTVNIVETAIGLSVLHRKAPSASGSLVSSAVSNRTTDIAVTKPAPAVFAVLAVTIALCVQSVSAMSEELNEHQRFISRPV